MKRTLVLSLIVLGLSVISQAQNKLLRNADAKSSVVAAFNHQCATDRFPRRDLQKLIRTAIQNAPNSYRTDGKHAVGYDLNADGTKEYFIVLGDVGIGDNVLWGIFSLRPRRFLGYVFGENIYIRKRAGGWSAFTISQHLSASDSFITTYGLRSEKYVRVAGGYEVSAMRNDSPKFSSRTSDLFLCER